MPPREPVSDPHDVHRLIAELERRIEAAGGGRVPCRDRRLSPEVTLRFLRRVLAREEVRSATLREDLRRLGVEAPPPETVADPDLGPVLWDVVRALAHLDTYLVRTDHLSDRELYECLWTEILSERAAPRREGEVEIVDLTSAGPEDGDLTYLRYYADERARRAWARERPEDEMPRREAPPHDRDWLLPRCALGPAWIA